MTALRPGRREPVSERDRRRCLSVIGIMSATRRREHERDQRSGRRPRSRDCRDHQAIMRSDLRTDPATAIRRSRRMSITAPPRARCRPGGMRCNAADRTRAGRAVLDAHLKRKPAEPLGPAGFATVEGEPGRPACTDRPPVDHFTLSSAKIDFLLRTARHEDRTDHDRHEGDDDRIPEAGVDLPVWARDREGGRRQQTTEPPVPMWYGSDRPELADAGGEEFPPASVAAIGRVDHRHEMMR